MERSRDQQEIWLGELGSPWAWDSLGLEFCGPGVPWAWDSMGLEFCGPWGPWARDALGLEFCGPEAG